MSETSIVNTPVPKRTYRSTLAFPQGLDAFSIQDLTKVNSNMSAASVRAKLKQAVIDGKVQRSGSNKTNSLGRPAFTYSLPN